LTESEPYIYMISTRAEVKSLPSGMQNVRGNGRLNCLKHLSPTTESRMIGMRPIRLRKMIPDSKKSSQILAYLGDIDGRHGVVGVFWMLMVSKLKLLKMKKMMQIIPTIHYCENGRN